MGTSKPWKANSRPAGPSGEATPKDSVVGAASGGKHPRRAFVALAVVVVGIVCLQVVIGVPQGLAGARTDHTNQALAGRIEANVDGYPGGFVRSVIGPLFPIVGPQANERGRATAPPQFVRHRCRCQVRAEGPIADTSPLITHISLPKNGAVLKGEGILSATTTDYFVTKVRFQITGEGLKKALLADG